MRTQIDVMREVFVEWLQMHDLDSDFWIYTQKEWSKREGEANLLKGAELIVAFENQLVDILEFGPFDVEEELQELAAGFGYWFERGHRWNIGFYPLDEWLPLPSKNAWYSEKLKDSRWQDKRKRILDRSKRSCEECGRADRPPEVHHTYYRFGRQPWQYPDGALLALCRECHKRRADVELRWRLFMPSLKTEEVEALQAMLKHSLYWFDRETLFEFLRAVEKCPYAHISKAVTPSVLVEKLKDVLATKGHPGERGKKSPPM